VGPLVAAWLVGEGIVVYRYVRQQSSPPVPGALLATSGLFVMLALLAEAPRARFLAYALAWGFDTAAFVNLFVNPPQAGQKTAAGLPIPTAAQASSAASRALNVANSAASGAVAGTGIPPGSSAGKAISSGLSGFLSGFGL
jgi:hypothetical protein